jgi:hypothetical protein
MLTQDEVDEVVIPSIKRNPAPANPERTEYCTHVFIWPKGATDEQIAIAFDHANAH